MKNTPKYQQVADSLAKLIEDGVLRPGEAVPSIRKLSRQWNVSISTVLNAYSRLEAKGLLQPRPRSGYYVSARLPSALPEPAVSRPEPDPRAVSMRELITMIILKDTANPELAQLGAAHPAAGLCATGKLNRHMAAAGRRMGDRSGLYLPPGGSSRLRRQIARHAIDAGCRLEAEELIITAGCGEAIYLCLKAVCRPGDTVAVESPICFDVFQYLENLGLKALEIPTHPREGISLEALRFAIEHNPVQACLVISNFNNPLGSCVPDHRKEQLVELLAEKNIPLIENDIFADIHYSKNRPFSAKAFDRQGMVLWCSSFSKTLSPGLRVGWAAPGKFHRQVEWLKFSANLATSTLPQTAVAAFMEEGGYQQHLRRIRRIYEQRLGALRQAVCRYFPENIKVTAPMGGYLLGLSCPNPSMPLISTKQRSGKALPSHRGICFPPPAITIILSVSTAPTGRSGWSRIFNALVGSSPSWRKAPFETSRLPRPGGEQSIQLLDIVQRLHLKLKEGKESQASPKIFSDLFVLQGSRLSFYRGGLTMPVYEFICEVCDHIFTVVLSLSEYEKEKVTCPKCKSPQVKRQISEFMAITSKKS